MYVVSDGEIKIASSRALLCLYWMDFPALGNTTYTLAV